jgi:hypothetical protein
VIPFIFWFCALHFGVTRARTTLFKRIPMKETSSGGGYQIRAEAKK